jgi:hypothetical protein
MAIREKDKRDRKRSKINEERAYKNDVLAMMVRQHDRLRGEVRATAADERLERKRETALALARTQSELHSAEVQWREKDEAKKQARRDKALQLAMEVRAKFVKDNFEMSAKGGRADAAEEGIKAREEKVKSDMERGFARAEKAAKKMEKFEEEQNDRLEAKILRQREIVKFKEQKEIRRVKKHDMERLDRMRQDNHVVGEMEATLRSQQAREFREERLEGIVLRKKANMYAVEQENAHRATRQRNAMVRQSSGRRSKQAFHHSSKGGELPGLDLARQLRGYSGSDESSARGTGQRSRPYSGSATATFDDTQVGTRSMMPAMV